MIMEPYIINHINKLASASNIILILTICLKLFSSAINDELFELLVSFAILFGNAGYLIFVGLKIFKNQKKKIDKMLSDVYRSIKSYFIFIESIHSNF